MTDQPTRLFVYGTLMPGCSNFRSIAGHVTGSRPGTIQGILFDLGAFPALVRGSGKVEGVLHELDAEALSVTDHIEGYHVDRDRSLYVREITEVDLGDGKVDAWTYYFAHPDHINDHPRLIVGEVDGIPIFRWSCR